MPVKHSDVRRQIVLGLYDLLLSSDEDAYWYSLSTVREYMDPEISGAQARIALDALVFEKTVEQGQDEDAHPVYALKEKGITAAERYASQGRELEDYAPPPSTDLILEKQRDAERIAALQVAIDDLRTQFTNSNATVELSQSDQDIIAGEIAAAEGISKAEAFRLRRLAVFILPVLRFLSDKFIGTALGEAAKHLIKLLIV